MKHVPTKSPPKLTDPDERWTAVQVGSLMRMTYQQARTAMLKGKFGDSEYDANTRRLTVSAHAVLAQKARKRSRKSSAKSPAQSTRKVKDR